MTDDLEREKRIREWLGTREAQSLLKAAARSALQTARERRLPFTFLGLEAWTKMDNAAILDDLESHLKLYLLENKRGIQERILFSGASAGRLLQQAFLLDWIDASRRRESDFWRYLHRRAVAAMAKNPEFLRMGTDEAKTCYSLSQGSVSIPDLSEDEMRAVPLPEAVASSLSRGELKRSETLLLLAKHFWKEISAQWEGRAPWIPVKCFVDWIALYVDVGGAKRVEPAFGVGDTLEDLSGGPSAELPFPFDEKQVASWAEKFAASLTEKEGHALRFHYGEGLTMAETAGRMGYRSASGVCNPIGRTQEKLRRFLRDLPWLSPPDLDQEAWSYFWETLLSYLKKNRLKP